MAHVHGMSPRFDHDLHAVHYLTFSEWPGDRSSDWAILVYIFETLRGLVVSKALRPMGNISWHISPSVVRHLNIKFITVQAIHLFKQIIHGMPCACKMKYNNFI